ncbi:MAG: transketolase [Actinomycetaceae bacterium]|nr:transketolase [Actinomycetaceae bacterium]
MLAKDDHQIERWRETRERLASLTTAAQAEELAEIARQTRREIVSTIGTIGQGHIGGDLSVVDALTTLYYVTLRIRPDEPTWPDRDVFVLSKGHCAVSFYTTLAHCGFFSPNALATFMAPLSELNGHPNRNKIPGVETNTGPLGHGIPVAVGCAAGIRLRGSNSRVFAICGDGELQEGSNWEAFMYAGNQHLGNLAVMVDRNRLQQGDGTEATNGLDPLDMKLAAFHWEIREIDGHDFEALIAAFQPSLSGKPVFIIANTVKGKGVGFMENVVKWHNVAPTVDETARALEELA